MDVFLCPLFQSRQSDSTMDLIFPSKGQALMDAVRKGNEPAVQRLLSRNNNNANPKFLLETRDNRYGRTPLHWACLDGYFTTVQLLLKRQSVTYFHEAVNAVDKVGFTPLTLAAYGGHLPIVQVLLDNGAQVEGSPLMSGQTPLHMACMQGHQDVVQYLMEKGADLQAPNRFGYSPLDLAAHYGRVGVTYTLLSQGASVKAKHHESGYTALHWACQLGHLDIARALADMDPEVVNQKNSQGSTPLHCACYGKDASVVLVKFLVLEKGADPTIANNCGKTPLDLATTDWYAEEQDVKPTSSAMEMACCANDDFMEFLLLKEESAPLTGAKRQKAVDVQAIYREHGRVAEFLTDFLRCGRDAFPVPTPSQALVPITPPRAGIMVPYDEVSYPRTNGGVRLVSPAAERAYIAQQEAQAIQKDIENRLQALTQLKQTKTVEIHQAIELAKAMCPSGDEKNEHWSRVVTLQKESTKLDATIQQLMSAPRPSSQDVAQYLGGGGMDVTPDTSVNNDEEVVAATSLRPPEPSSLVAVTQGDFFDVEFEPNISEENETTYVFDDDPRNVRHDSFEEETPANTPMEETNTFDEEEQQLYLKTPAAAE